MDRLTDIELRVLLCICRNTFGWHKEKIKASISFIMQPTGVSKQGVIDGTARLLDRGVLTRKKDGQSFVYSIDLEPVNPVDNGQSLPVSHVDNLPEKGVNPADTLAPEPVSHVDTTKKEGKQTSLKKAVSVDLTLPAVLNTEGFRKVWLDWHTFRREIKHALTPTTEARQLALLAGLGETRAIATVERSIQNGWQGLFPESPAKPAKPAYSGSKPDYTSKVF